MTKNKKPRMGGYITRSQNDRTAVERLEQENEALIQRCQRADDRICHLGSENARLQAELSEEKDQANRRIADLRRYMERGEAAQARVDILEGVGKELDSTVAELGQYMARVDVLEKLLTEVKDAITDSIKNKLSMNNQKYDYIGQAVLKALSASPGATGEDGEK